MEQVPNIISTKDLSYLSDIFEWNYTASKECLHFSKKVQAEDIQNTLQNVANMHEQICQKIISILKEGE